MNFYNNLNFIIYFPEAELISGIFLNHPSQIK